MHTGILFPKLNTPWLPFSCSIKYDPPRQWHSTPVLLPGKIPWMEEPGRLQSMGSLRVGYHWATSLSLFTFKHWRRKWQPPPVFLPGESQGRRGLGSMASHRVGHDWSDLAAAAATSHYSGLWWCAFWATLLHTSVIVLCGLLISHSCPAIICLETPPHPLRPTQALPSLGSLSRFPIIKFAFPVIPYTSF